MVHVWIKGPDWAERPFGQILSLRVRWGTLFDVSHRHTFLYKRGAVGVPVHQLRDPYIYEENGQLYILYSGAGEQNIGP